MQGCPNLTKADFDFVAARSVAVQSTPLWIYDFCAHVIPWANPAGLDFWSADTVEALARRSFKSDMSESVAARLCQYQEDFRRNPQRVFTETWTLYPSGKPVLLDCLFYACTLPGGRECMLVEARSVQQTDPATQRAIDAVLHSQVMTALFSEDGTELFANRAMREALGPRPTRFREWFSHPEEHQDFMLGLSMAGSHRETVQMATQDGRRWYALQASKCRDAATGHAAFQVSATDVTAMRSYESELKSARDHARNADRAKLEFLASMSHEMRTPMNGILGMIALISKSDLTKDQTQQVQVVQECGLALLELIEDVLDMSSIELRALKVECHPMDPLAIAETVVNGLRQPARLKELHLNLDHDGEVPNAGFGDPRRFAQLLRNLISNAIKYTDEGEISLRLQRSGATGLRVEVADTGPGVSEADRERVFERFQRGKTEGGSRTGIGLGLSICKDLVTLQGGEIGVTAAQGGGACFWFTLPKTFGEGCTEAIAAMP